MLKYNIELRNVGSFVVEEFQRISYPDNVYVLEEYIIPKYQSEHERLQNSKRERLSENLQFLHK